MSRKAIPGGKTENGRITTMDLTGTPEIENQHMCFSDISPDNFGGILTAAKCSESVANGSRRQPLLLEAYAQILAWRSGENHFR
jgi:hypothetical protein